ncbi:MAG TPA: ABC transporter permease [Candidatus Anoxymicrobiaceae bacterium]
MRQFAKFLRASLKMIYREKVALFWMFLFPIILMLLLGTIFGRSNQTISIGVVDLDKTVVTNAVTGALKEIKAFDVSSGTLSKLKENLQNGKINAVLVLNKGFFDSVKQGKAGKATIYVDQSSATVSDITYSTVSQVLGKIVQGMAKIPDLIVLNKQSVVSNDMRYVDFIVPGVLAMTLMTSGLLGLSLAFVQYREKGILRRIKVSPLPLSRFIGSELTADLIMALIQAAILLLVGKLVFKIHIRGNFINIAFLVILGAATFLAAGFLIASITKTLKTAEMASNAITFPMMFLSGVFIPLAVLPPVLVTVAKALPLYYLGHALREVMIRGKMLWAVWPDILVLIGVGLICFLISIKLFRWE